MNTTTYQVVLFNNDRPAVPGNAKDCFINKAEYDSLVNGWTNEIQLGPTIYKVVSWRAFDMNSDLWGNRCFIVMDVIKKIETI